MPSNSIPDLSDIFNEYKHDRDIYHDLMRDKVREVLLVASLFDAFTLEREGRLSEAIFGEYYQLSLTSAPRVTPVSYPQKALEWLRNRRFDMVILMVGIDRRANVELAARIKELDPHMPVLMLVNNNKDIHLFSGENKPEHVDWVFVWNGDTTVFLAMIKLMEDRMNVRRDTQIGLVRVVLLIEDSVRYCSRYLPLLYSEIVKQTQALISEENLDEVNKVPRMRARPKVLLATNYEEAQRLFETYRDYILCVISDVKYSRGGEVDPEAGLRFISYVKRVAPDTPTLLQSSEAENRHKAESLGAAFIHKHSHSIGRDLSNFMLAYCGFGPFVFRNSWGEEIASARNLEEFEAYLHVISDETFLYHSSRNQFSTWLMARGEIRRAKELRRLKISDFSSVDEMRRLLIDYFHHLTYERNRGEMVNFDESLLGDSRYITSLAGGALGGKGRGLLFVNNLLERIEFSRIFDDVQVSLPHTAIIGTDEFENFLSKHRLHDAWRNTSDFKSLQGRFLSCRLSDELQGRLRSYLGQVNTPLAVRSSGILEDMLNQPFAGIYVTFMLPNNHPDLDVRLGQLCDAVRLVYASVFSPKARSYFDAVNYQVEEEKMAVIIQRVVGRKHEQSFYPDISGTAQSYNYYPVSSLRADDGVSTIALGLGRYVVDGEKAFRFSPRYPKMDLVAPEHQMESAQQHFYAIDLGRKDVNLADGEDSSYVTLSLEDAERHGTLQHLASTYDYQYNRITPGILRPGPRVLNFADILKYNYFGLGAAIDTVLQIIRESMRTPVEIEFSVNLEKNRHGKFPFHVLQIKPLVQQSEKFSIDLDTIDRDKLVLFTEKGMGNGRNDTLRDFVFVDPDTFDNSRTVDIAGQVGYLNQKLKSQGLEYILLGPGRWGTRDPWLGIPVNFGQISSSRVIAEVALPDFRVDSSLGSHFFHNVTSMNIGYFTIPARKDQGFVDWDWLKTQPVIERTEHLFHVRVEEPVTVLMDGTRGISVIAKPKARIGTDI